MLECVLLGDETGKEEPLFHPPRQCIGARDVEYQRVVQVQFLMSMY